MNRYSHSAGNIVTEYTYEKFVLIFIFLVPYGYFGVNLLHSNTNPLSMYLLPVLLLLIAPRVSKIWDIELALVLLLSILCLTVAYEFIRPFNPTQALIRIAGYAVGFSYFLLAARKFHADIDVEHWLLIAHYPLLLLGIFQIGVIATGAFTEINILLRTVLVSEPAIVPSRLSLLSSEPSFIAFQVPLLLYLIHRKEQWTVLIVLFAIIAFTKSINVYLTTVLFYVAYLGHQTVINETDPKQIAAIIIGGMMSLLFILNVPTVRNRVLSITQDTSVLERFNYIVSTIAMIWEYPLGVGVGQYGTYVKEIFELYDIPIAAPWVVYNLNTGTLDPWSLVLGLIAEGGMIIAPIITYVFVKLFHASKHSSTSFAAFFSGSFLLFQTYPPATPFVWIVFGLIWGWSRQVVHE